jgi:transcriptional regulator with XRE-family HTH domain
MTPVEFRAARKSLGLTQEQCARLLGYGSKVRISEIENGKRGASDAVLLLLGAFLSGYRPPDWPKAKGRE